MPLGQISLRIFALVNARDIPCVSAEMLRSILAVLFAVVAGLIATRGWLMHEEDVLRPLRDRFIRLDIWLIYLAAGMLLFSLQLPLHDLLPLLLDCINNK